MTGKNRSEPLAVPKVGVILLNWNGGEFTIPCIRTLLQSEFKPWRILVFDNASDDGSPERIATLFPQVEVVRSDRNLGFTGANNEGIRLLKKQGADLIWILNNDTIVDKSCLKNLVEQMELDPDLAVSTGKILFEKPPNQIWYAGGHWRYWTLSAPHVGANELDNGQYDRPLDVSFVSGCCMLVRAWAFDRVGTFSEKYFAISEDGDWCLRAVKTKLRMRYIPAAILWHKVSASQRKNTLGKCKSSNSPFTNYLTTRNDAFIILQHAESQLQRMSALSWFIIDRLYVIGGLTVLRRWDTLRGVLYGLYDGLSNKGGLSTSLQRLSLLMR